jgi:uncharacterized membrane protein
MDGVELGLALAGAFVLGAAFGALLRNGGSSRRPWWMDFANPPELVDARRVLAERYALGEITAEEYRTRVEDLRVTDDKGGFRLKA